MTNTNGSFHSEAMLSVSWNAPCLEAPSPKKDRTTLPFLAICFAQATPAACGMPAPTMPEVPRKPRFTSVRCMEPPSPLQSPSARPKISAIMALGSLPRTIGYPWQRYVASAASPSRKWLSDPTMDASAPSARCVCPRITPGCSVKVRLTRSSKVRMRSIWVKIQIWRSALGGCRLMASSRMV